MAMQVGQLEAHQETGMTYHEKTFAFTFQKTQLISWRVKNFNFCMIYAIKLSLFITYQSYLNIKLV